jgi:Tat protein secretion system quality control protein TatD with DNase activity
VSVLSHLIQHRLLTSLILDAPWCSITSTASSHKHLADFKEGIQKTKKFDSDVSKGVKGRNEPGDVRLCILSSWFDQVSGLTRILSLRQIAQIAHVVARVKGIDLEALTEAAWNNTMDLFYTGRSS